jgi:hypothetical protein
MPTQNCLPDSHLQHPFCTAMSPLSQVLLAHPAPPPACACPASTHPTLVLQPKCKPSPFPISHSQHLPVLQYASMQQYCGSGLTGLSLLCCLNVDMLTHPTIPAHAIAVALSCCLTVMLPCCCHCHHVLPPNHSHLVLLAAHSQLPLLHLWAIQGEMGRDEVGCD